MGITAAGAEDAAQLVTGLLIRHKDLGLDAPHHLKARHARMGTRGSRVCWTAKSSKPPSSWFTERRCLGQYGRKKTEVVSDWRKDLMLTLGLYTHRGGGRRKEGREGERQRFRAREMIQWLVVKSTSYSCR